MRQKISTAELEASEADAKRPWRLGWPDNREDRTVATRARVPCPRRPAMTRAVRGRCFADPV